MDQKKPRTWLKEKRKAAGFTLRGFARQISLSPSYYYEIEKGVKKPGAGAAYKISQALEFDMSVFYGPNVPFKGTKEPVNK